MFIYTYILSCIMMMVDMMVRMPWQSSVLGCFPTKFPLTMLHYDVHIGFHKWGYTPKWMDYFMENHGKSISKWMIIPYYTSILGNLRINIAEFYCRRWPVAGAPVVPTPRPSRMRTLRGTRRPRLARASSWERNHGKIVGKPWENADFICKNLDFKRQTWEFKH